MTFWKESDDKEIGILWCFQFCETMQKALQAVLVVMATFSECYDEPSQVMQLASSLLNSGKYVLDQELRARQVRKTFLKTQVHAIEIKKNWIS